MRDEEVVRGIISRVRAIQEANLVRWGTDAPMYRTTDVSKKYHDRVMHLIKMSKWNGPFGVRYNPEILTDIDEPSLEIDPEHPAHGKVNQPECRTTRQHLLAIGETGFSKEADLIWYVQPDPGVTGDFELDHLPDQLWCFKDGEGR